MKTTLLLLSLCFVGCNRDAGIGLSDPPGNTELVPPGGGGGGDPIYPDPAVTPPADFAMGDTSGLDSGLTDNDGAIDNGGATDGGASDLAGGLNACFAYSKCVLTVGYYGTHGCWPVSGVLLGARVYTQAEASSILSAPVSGNGLISLAHQLIAAKLNIAAGADASGLGSAIADADALIGSLIVPPVGSGSLATSSTSALVVTLTSFNQGDAGPSHCN